MSQDVEKCRIAQVPLYICSCIHTTITSCSHKLPWLQTNI